MDSTEKIAQADLAQMKIIHYGDPRLTEPATPIEQIDQSVLALAQRMFQVMSAAEGVGLAAPQVGVTVRIFVASPTVSPDDRRVYVNPRIVSTDGSQQFDEGCLSVPGVTGKIKRFHTITIEATDLDGEKFTETGTDLLARIFQHEMDHLDGRLIIDRMGSVARIAHQRTLNQLQTEHDSPEED